MKKNSEHKTKVLFFANFPTKDKQSIGGATTLSKRIYDYIAMQPEVAVTQVQIRKFWKSKLQIIDYLCWIVKFPFVIYQYDVISFHVTRDFHVSAGPFLWLWAKLLRKRTTYHLFGGGFYRQYRKLPKPFRWLIKNTILQSDAFIVETKELIHDLESIGQKNLVWLPNSRKPVTNFTKDRTYNKKIAFISRILPGKGIPETIAAAKILQGKYQIDVYGPLDEKFKTNPFLNTAANYKGVLHHDEIVSTLDQYSVLIMPTYIDREGYPGIIIEALSIGVPVITTKCCVMHEMITNQYNGLLITPRSGEALATAITLIDASNYKDYSKNALQSFSKFNSDIVFHKFIDAYLGK